MNKKLLFEIGEVQTHSGQEYMMVEYIQNHATKLGLQVEYDQKGNMYITKGVSENYPCIVAHLDSVFPIEDDLHLIEVDGKVIGFNRLTMEQRGVGWDDKIGLYIALQLLEETDNIKVAFFLEEEIGCCGSYESDMKFFEDCGYVLQCDRSGNSDFVTTACGVDLSSQDFQTTIQHLVKHKGYTFCKYGGMTDVMALKERGLQVSCANISCGYYEAHMENEYIVLEDVQNTLDLVRNVVNYIGEERFEHTHEEITYRHKEYVLQWDMDEDPACSDCLAHPANLDSGLCDECEKYYELEYGFKFH